MTPQSTETDAKPDVSLSDAQDRILMGKDTESLQIALQRLYQVEHQYRQEIGRERPEWLTEMRTLLEELLGSHEVYEHDN